MTSKLNQHLRRHDIALAPNVVRKKVRIDNDGEFLIQFNESLARILGFVHSTIYRPRVSLYVAPNQYNLSAIVLPTMYVYCGSRHQRGHGLGSVLSGLLRSVIVPFLKRNVSALAGNALKTGAQFVDDMVCGKTFKETAKKRMPEAIKTTLRDVDWQTGSGKSKRKRRRRHKDIFD